MGCGASVPTTQLPTPRRHLDAKGNSITAETSKSIAIDREMEKHRVQEANVTRILMLGSGHSGKSTLLKQVQLLYGEGFSATERRQYRDLIWRSTIETMKMLASFAYAKAESTRQGLVTLEDDRSTVLSNWSASGYPRVAAHAPASTEDDPSPYIRFMLHMLNDDKMIYDDVIVSFPYTHHHSRHHHHVFPENSKLESPLPSPLSSSLGLRVVSGSSTPEPLALGGSRTLTLERTSSSLQKATIQKARHVAFASAAEAAAGVTSSSPHRFDEPDAQPESTNTEESVVVDEVGTLNHATSAVLNLIQKRDSPRVDTPNATKIEPHEGNVTSKPATLMPSPASSTSSLGLLDERETGVGTAIVITSLAGQQLSTPKLRGRSLKSSKAKSGTGLSGSSGGSMRKHESSFSHGSSAHNVLENSEHQPCASPIQRSAHEKRRIPLHLVLSKVWNSQQGQEAFMTAERLESPIEYFMSNIERIARADYVPSDEDILSVRKRTSGVCPLHFAFEENRFILIDVGGQRVERSKWLSNFDTVDVVIFVVALDQYDQVMLEDGETNRLRDALTLFTDMCASPWLKSSPFLLILNKSDVFKEKIKTIPLTTCFKSYQGDPHDYEESVNYVKYRFREIYRRVASNANAVFPRKPDVECIIGSCLKEPDSVRLIVQTSWRLKCEQLKT